MTDDRVALIEALQKADVVLRFRVEAALAGEPAAPAVRTGEADPEVGRSLMTRRSGLDGTHDALAQIDGQGLRASALSFVYQCLRPSDV